MRTKACLLIFSLLFLAACAGGPHVNEEVGVVSGAAVGAGAGAAVGNASGNAGSGALLGGVTGAVVGGVSGAAVDRKGGKKKEEDLTIRRQKKELQKQQGELDDIERQRYHDQKLDEYLEERQ